MKQRALRPAAEKICIYCGIMKPAADYHSHRYTTRTGRESVRLNSACRPCHSSRMAAHKLKHRRTERYKEARKAYRSRIQDRTTAQLRADREANPEKWANYYLKRQYGITYGEYMAMSAAQGGRCKVCGELPTVVGKKRALHVDHCHKSGKIRGLLCHQCNVSIGLLKDDPAIIRSLLLYVETA